MAGYTRQSTFADGDTITAALFNNEYNQLLNAFNSLSGHKHDGTTGEGAVIALIGDTGVATPLNKVLIDTSNDHIEFWVDVSSSSVQQLYIADGAIVPVTDNDIDLGTSSLQFKDLYINGTATIDILTVDEAATIGTTLGVTGATTLSSTLAVTGTSTLTGNVTTTNDLSVGGNLTVTGNATISGNLTFGDADTDSINLAAEIDSHIVPNTSNTYDLGTSSKQWRNIFSAGTLHADAINFNGTAITATAAELNILDGVTSTAAELNILDGKAFLDEDNMVSNSATGIASQQSIKAYVDAQVTAQDLDITTDSGTIAIDLDSETLTVSGGTGLDSSATGNAVTLAIDSTVTTLTGTQTLTNKTLTTPVISSISNTGTLTLPTSTDTLVGRATTDTLTNKTLTSPVINTGVSGTAFLDDDTFATATASTLASSESIKAYVDTTVAATNEVVEDTTPQLGGDLDTNGNDILFADNDKAIFGTGSDLQISHTGAASLISDTGTGDLFIRASNALRLQSADNENYLVANANGSLNLYYDNTQKLQTTSTGIDVTGTVVADGLTVDGAVEASGNLTLDGAGQQINFTGGGTNKITSNTSLNLDFDTDNNQSGMDFTISHNGGADLFIINNSGNVGIGTDSPAESLHTIGNIRFGDSAPAELYTNSSELRLGVDRNNDNTTSNITFYTNNDEKVRIDADGNVGIGTSSPNAALDAVGSSNVVGEFTSTATSKSNNTYTLMIDSSAHTSNLSSAGAMSVDVNSGRAFTINGLGRVGIGTDSPAAPLHISNTYPVIRLTDSDGAVPYAQIINSAGILQLRADDGNSTANSSMQFFVDGGEKARIDSSGNVGIGESSPDSILHIKKNQSGANSILKLENAAGGDNSSFSIDWQLASSGTSAQIKANRSNSPGAGDTDLIFSTSTTGTTLSEAMRIDSSGDLTIQGGRIYLKESDLGNNAVAITRDSDEGYLQLFSSGSQTAELRGNGNSYINGGNVGIGTSSPNSRLVVAASNGGKGIELQANTGSIQYLLAYDRSASDYIDMQIDGKNLIFATNNGTERMRIDSSGNVGIGTSSPNRELELAAVNPRFRITDTDGGFSEISGNSGHLGFTADAGNTQSGTRITFDVDDFEAMRIDSLGNVLVGKTSAALAGAGTAILSTGTHNVTVDGDTALQLNRLTSNGNLITFYKDTSSVGSIGSGVGDSSASTLYIADAGNVGIRFDQASTDDIQPCNSSGADRDNAINLGASDNRFKDLYLSGNAIVSKVAGDGDTDTAIDFISPNIIAMNTGGSERMRIDSSGNVGIGTASPDTKLHVYNGTSGTIATISGPNSYNAESGLEFSVGRAKISGVLNGSGGTPGSSLRFYTMPNSGSVTEAMRIDSLGNLLVGGTSSGQDDSFAASSSGNITIARASGSSRTMASFLNGGSTVGSIVTSTTATTYNTSSDGRLKDVTGEARGLEVINELNPVSYNWKADGKADEGLIAQEVQKIVPNAVTGSEEEMYQMDYSKLVVHLVKGMKEQQTQIEALQSEINLLKGE